MSSRFDRWLGLILVAATIFRVHSALQSQLFWDEREGYVALSKSISFEPGKLHLPLRGQNHPALVAYIVKASGEVFGETRFGYRILHVFVGLATILLVYRVTLEWYGVTAARWAAALLSFNEYHVGVSGVASSHAPQLFFIALSIFTFSRFLRNEHPAMLYAAAVATALSYYCKEHSALLLPVYAVVLLRAPLRRWYTSPHLYLALGGFLLLVAPDVIWNFTTESLTQATYRDHMTRVGGIGLAWDPWAFFAHDQITRLHFIVTGRQFWDGIVEYASMNALFGILLLLGVFLSAFRKEPATVQPFLFAHFCLVVGVFALIRPPEVAARGLDPASWAWVDASLLSSTVLTGSVLATPQGRIRGLVVWSLALVAMAWATFRIFT